jgi:hypothetical protein
VGETGLRTSDLASREPWRERCPTRGGGPCEIGASTVTGWRLRWHHDHLISSQAPHRLATPQGFPHRTRRANAPILPSLVTSHHRGQVTFNRSPFVAGRRRSGRGRAGHRLPRTLDDHVDQGWRRVEADDVGGIGHDRPRCCAAPPRGDDRRWPRKVAPEPKAVPGIIPEPSARVERRRSPRCLGHRHEDRQLGPRQCFSVSAGRLPRCSPSAPNEKDRHYKDEAAEPCQRRGSSFSHRGLLRSQRRSPELRTGRAQRGSVRLAGDPAKARRRASS